MVWQRRKGKRKSRVCRPQHNHGHMIPHAGTSCIFLGFILSPPLIFVSVSELIRHVLFLVLCIFNWVLVHFLEGWWEIQYGHMFFSCLVFSLQLYGWFVHLFFPCVFFISWSVSLALLCSNRQVLSGLFPQWEQRGLFSILSHTCYSCGAGGLPLGRKGA